MKTGIKIHIDTMLQAILRTGHLVAVVTFNADHELVRRTLELAVEDHELANKIMIVSRGDERLANKNYYVSLVYNHFKNFSKIKDITLIDDNYDNYHSFTKTNLRHLHIPEEITIRSIHAKGDSQIAEYSQRVLEISEETL